MPTFNVNPVGPAGKQRMSNLSDIRTAFERLINEEGHRTAFWNDPDQEFFTTVPHVERFCSQHHCRFTVSKRPTVLGSRHGVDRTRQQLR
jgi:hypothetical protein